MREDDTPKFTDSDLGTSKAGAGVETDTISTCRPVNFNLTGIRLEVMGGIFSGDTTLNSESSLGDRFLGQTELRKCTTGCNLDLSGDNIDTGDFL